MNNYIVKDYEGFRDMMIKAIPTVCPEWTDLSSTDMGIVLVELLSLGLDVLSYYQDRAISESNLSTARTRESVIKLCRMLTYELDRQTPSRFVLRVHKEEGFVGSVVIPRGFKVSTEDSTEEGIIFETDADVMLSGEFADVTCTQCVTIEAEQHYVAVNYAIPSYRLTLNNPDVLIEDILLQVIVNQVIYTWRHVEDFLNTTQYDNHYTAEVDADNYTTLVFGDGVTGKLLPNNCEVRVTYAVGGGAVGNVGLNTITKCLSEMPIGLSRVTNTELIEYGKDVETLESAKRNAPSHFKANQRAVTKRDYEYFLRRHPNIIQANVVETYNTFVDLHILTKSLTYPTSLVEQEAILEYMNEFRLANVKLRMESIPIVKYKLKVTFNVLSGYIQIDVQDKVSYNLKEELHASKMIVGEPLLAWKIYKLVSLVDGVEANSINIKFGGDVVTPSWVDNPPTVTANDVAHLTEVIF
jgi:hypothetical protein